MCRGCNIKFKGKPDCCDEYLDWFGDYQANVSRMKKLESDLISFIDGMDDKNQKRKIDNFRRRLIKQRKEYSKASELLLGI